VINTTVTALSGNTISNTVSLVTGTVLELDNSNNAATDSDPVVADVVFLNGFE